MPDHFATHRARRLSFVTQVVPGAVYLALLFYSGLIRLGRLPQVGFIATDKLLHALAFGGLAVLVARATHWFRSELPIRKKLFLGALGSSFAGMMLEVLQAFTSFRSADLWDWVADTVGAVLAVLACQGLLVRSRADG